MIRIILQEYLQKEYLADICKVALLKYYVGKEVEPAIANVLQECFKETSKKRMVFPFYLQYPQEWLRKMQLHDKVMVEYQAAKAGKVKVFYRLQKDGEAADEYRAETLLPVYDNVYLKEFVLYEDESLTYYFEESASGQVQATEKAQIRKNNDVYEDGKYCRLNLISRLSQNKQYEAMLHYKKEEQVAETLFQTY